MNSREKILKLLFQRPTYRFHIRELARESGLNPNTIINISDKLEKERIIRKEKKKNLVEVFLNIENRSIINMKRIFNLFQVYESGIIEFLIGKYSPSSISLIGSYSRGEDIEKSDIDFVIFSNEKRVVDIHKFEKKLLKNVHLIIIKKREKVSKEFFNNLINGIVVYGAVKK